MTTTTRTDLTLNVALCKGRHDIPLAVDGSIFPSTIEDVTDTARLERMAFNGLWNIAYDRYLMGERTLRVDPEWDGSDSLPLQIANGITINIYVTGLTVALIAALNVCKREECKIVLWHYDNAGKTYYSQEVL